MHLAKLGVSGIRVIDFDLEGSLSSSELNAGGVRATWTQPLNVRMSQLTIDYLAQHASEVGYRACGYLWLHSPERMELALRARERQVALGWPVEAWDTAELRRRVPFIDKTGDVAGAVFAPRDGLVNPNLLKNHFRSRARENGVVFDDRTMLRSAGHESGFVRCVAERFEQVMSHETKVEILAHEPGIAERRPVEYRAKKVVNCAGPWAAPVARALGYSCPSKAVRRQISIFDSREVDLTPYGMIVDTSGVYFHSEATNGLAGFATPSEPEGYSYAYDSDTFFNEIIWPALYERATGFERLKHLTGWAGLYEVSPDECAILGPVTSGEAGRRGAIFEAHSFSGHGVMHSHAAGLLLAERIVHGSYRTIDVTELSGARFETGKLLGETLVI
jgi:sarcosine oxidase subunit beta